MNLKRILLFSIFTFLQHNLYAYQHYSSMSLSHKYFDVKICRRNLIKGLAIVPMFELQSRYASAEDRPLSKEEMEEYNKLLKEADRIKKIIDININATKEELGTDKENGLEKYIRENNIKKMKN